MENTVVGVYDSYAQAQNVLSELQACGFSSGDVRLSPDSTRETTEHPSESRIGHFFRSLFGMEHEEEHGDVYSEAVRRGHCVVTVDADSEERRERAVEVMNRYDPVNIEERASHWRSQGWTGYDDAAPMYTDSEIEKDRSTYAQGGNGRVRTFARETEFISPGDYADTAMTSDDSDYRTHWQNAYGQSGGRYEDYDAAYRYGSTMAGSERFRNYRWEDAEPGMRSDWERDHPESTWDKIKDAVRYGAERVSGHRH